jgi:hypothetical protein
LISIDRVDLAKVNGDEYKWVIVSGDNEGVYALTTTAKRFYRSNITNVTPIIKGVNAAYTHAKTVFLYEITSPGNG